MFKSSHLAHNNVLDGFFFFLWMKAKGLPLARPGSQSQTYPRHASSAAINWSCKPPRNRVWEVGRAWHDESNSERTSSEKKRICNSTVLRCLEVSYFSCKSWFTVTNYSTKPSNEIMPVFLKADNNAEPKMMWKEFRSSVNSVAVLFWKDPQVCVWWH